MLIKCRCRRWGPRAALGPARRSVLDDDDDDDDDAHQYHSNVVFWGYFFLFAGLPGGVTLFWPSAFFFCFRRAPAA